MCLPKDKAAINTIQYKIQHNSESVWASISLKDHSKLIVGSFYRPPDNSVANLAAFGCVRF